MKYRPLAVILVALIGLESWFFWKYPPGRALERSYPVQPPFASVGGDAFAALVPVAASSDRERPGSSRLRLTENGRPLGPAHCSHQAIRDHGAGSFSHWGNQLVFSASDNSDPNSNGRRYAVIRPWALPPIAYLAALAPAVPLLMFSAFVLLRPLKRFPRLQRYMFTVAVTGVALGFVQVAAWVCVEDRIHDLGPTVENWYRFAFADGSDGFEPGTSIIFQKHHFLNYALNPDVPYCGERQFNADFLIRRKEPIRPREAVSARVLALGGSTTFGEGTPREEDTWVHQLEGSLRRQFGPNCDVINGGVGGYTILENLIHYVTLLDALEPDVVLIYQGINDVLPRSCGVNRTDYSNFRKPWSDPNSVFPDPNRSLAWFYPYRLYFVVSTLGATTNRGIGAMVSRDCPPTAEWAAPLARNDSSVFRRHYENLVRLLLAQGRKVVLVPQYFRDDAPGDEVFRRGVDQHNEVVRSIADELRLPFAGRVLDTTAFSHDDTYDSCHFQTSGHEKLARILERVLMDSELVPEVQLGRNATEGRNR